MKPIHIFKPGTHTSAEGVELSYSEQKLQGIAKCYDKSVHMAPIVVGHPANNGPAFGWISDVQYNEESGNLYAVPEQVNDDFAELVKSGAYKKVSASFYTPASPNNPFPGEMCLRHVGFLGAQPPAIKGLEPVSFADDEAETFEVEFSDFDQASWSLASFAQALREWMIEKFGKEEADQVIRNWEVDDFKRAAESNPESNDNPEYSEGDGMTEEELQAEKDKLKKERDALDADKRALDADKASFSDSQKSARKKEIEARVDKAIEDNQLTPAHRDGMVAFCEGLSEETEICFGEGEQEQKQNPIDFVFGVLASTTADFGEHSQDDDESDPEKLGPADFSEKVQSYMDEQAANGKTVTVVEATSHVRATLGIES